MNGFHADWPLCLIVLMTLVFLLVTVGADRLFGSLGAGQQSHWRCADGAGMPADMAEFCSNPEILKALPAAVDRGRAPRLSATGRR